MEIILILIPLSAIIGYFCIVIPEVSLCITLFVVYSHISQFFGHLFLPMVIITLASLALYKLYKGELSISYLPINKFIFLFVLTILLSSFGTQDWGRAAYDLSFFLKSLVLFFLIVNIVKDEKTIISLIKMVVIATLFGSIIALYQFSGATRIFLFSGRTGSILGDPNFFASMLVSILPFSIFLLKKEKNIYSKMFWGISTLILLFSIVPTFSRGGIIGLVIILSLIFIHERRNKYIWLFLPLVFLIFVALVPYDFWLRALTLLNATSDLSIYHRLNIVLSGIKVFSHHPIIGVGIGDYINSTSRYITDPMVAHNMYLHVFVETGIIGGTLFLFILGSVIRGTHRLKQRSELSTYMEISLIGLFVTAIFLSIHFHFWVWTLLGIVSAFLKVKNQW